MANPTESARITPQNPAPGARAMLRSPLIFDDLVADLTWPRLLKAGSLAIRPARVGLGFFYLLGLGVLLSLADGLDGIADRHVFAEAGGQAWSRFGAALDAAINGRIDQAGNALHVVFFSIPGALLREHTLATVILFPLLLVWTALFGGAIARTAATESAMGVTLSWPQGLGFAVSRLRPLVWSIALPLILIWLVWFGLAVGGWVLFSLSGVNVLGGLLWPIFLLFALIASVMIFAYILGHSMLIPTIACEGTDAIDAVQHAYSYVLARPVRLLIYAAILFVQFFLWAVVIGIVLWLTVNLAHAGASAWTGQRGDTVISLTPPPPPSSPATDAAAATPAATPAGTAAPFALNAADRLASWLLKLWHGVFQLAFGGFCVSFYWCASTLLYLAMRRLVDAQDMNEVWMPGMVGGTMAQSSAAASSSTPRSDAVADNGPADEG